MGSNPIYPHHFHIPKLFNFMANSCQQQLPKGRSKKCCRMLLLYASKSDEKLAVTMGAERQVGKRARSR